MITIDDPDDRRVEPYRAVRDRDLVERTGIGRGREGRFVAEGAVVVRALLSARSRYATESILIAKEKAGPLTLLLDRVPPGVPIYAASRAVMDAVVGFPIHRGLLAIGVRRGMRATDLLPGEPKPSLVLGLVGLANHDNVGAVFRNAAAFGADAVLLDGGSCDPLYRKAIRVSVGACLTVPFARCEDADLLIGLLEEAGYDVFALSTSGQHTVESTNWPARTAILVGAEGPGLPPSVLTRVSTLRIAMEAGFDSLNVATATGIAMHAARSSRRSD